MEAEPRGVVSANPLVVPEGLTLRVFVNPVLHKAAPQMFAGLQPGWGVRRKLVSFIASSSALPPASFPLEPGILSSALIYTRRHSLSD